MIEALGTVLGLTLLLSGGIALVRGASQVATRFGLSEMLVGLTVVAFGTSVPELVVNIMSGMRGQTELAFGNVIGSNIANFGLVLGAAAVIAPIHIQGQVVRRELPLLLLATSIITVMALDGVLLDASSRVDRSESIVLLLLFLIFLYLVVSDIVRAHDDDPLFLKLGRAPLATLGDADRYRWLLVSGGVALLYIGGELTVRNAIGLARIVELPSEIIGLFVVAIGTSLPELVTSIVAALRRAPDLAVGNVIGSNLFNSLIVLPSAGLWASINVPAGGVTDLVISLLLVALLIPLFYFGQARLGRPSAFVFLSAYLAYAIWRVTAS